MISEASSSPLLRLPRELRYEIYHHLCRQDFKSYPFDNLAISSIDQTGPPTALLLTCHYLCDEIHAYFIAKVTLGFVTQHSRLGHRNNDSILLGAIQKVKKVSVRIDWSGFRLSSVDIRHWPYSLNGWLADVVNILLDKAESLEIITVSVVELPRGTNREQQEMALAPLKNLAGRVRFRLSDVICEDEEEAELREWLSTYLKELNEGTLPAAGS